MLSSVRSAKSKSPDVRALDPHAVDQHLHLGRVGAANAHGRELPRAARGLHLDAGDGPQRLLDRPGTPGRASPPRPSPSPTPRSARRAPRSASTSPRSGSARRDLGPPGRRPAPPGPVPCAPAGPDPSHEQQPPAPTTRRRSASSLTPLPRRGVSLVRPDRSPDSWLVAPAAPSRGTVGPSGVRLRRTLPTHSCGTVPDFSPASRHRDAPSARCSPSPPSRGQALTSKHFRRLPRDVRSNVRIKV